MKRLYCDMWGPIRFLVVLVEELCCCFERKIATVIVNKLLNFTVMHLELSLPIKKYEAK